MSTEENRDVRGEYNSHIDDSVEIDLDMDGPLDDLIGPNEEISIDLDMDEPLDDLTVPNEEVSIDLDGDLFDSPVDDNLRDSSLGSFNTEIELNLDSASLGYIGEDDYESDEVNIDFDEEVTEEDEQLIAGISEGNFLPSPSVEDDDVWDDSDFYTSAEALEESKNKMIESVKRKKKKTVVTIEENAVFNSISLNDKVFSYAKEIIHYFKGRFNKSSSEKALGGTIMNAPDFLGIADQNRAYSSILSDTSIDLKLLYKSLEIPDVYKSDEAKYLTFCKWAEELKEYQIKNISITNYSSEILEHLCYDLLGIYLPFVLKNSVKIGDKLKDGLLFTFKKFISNNKMITHYVCPKCGEKVLVPQKFIVFMFDSNDYRLIYDPLECSCGALTVFDKSSYEFIAKQFVSLFKILRPEYSNPYQSLRSYVPTFDSLQTWISECLEVDTEMDNLLESPNEEGEENMESLTGLESYTVDWESACRDFYSFINMVGDAKFKLKSVATGSLQGVKNITKILVNQTNSYKVLKEHAYASLITSLMELGLSNFSLYNKTFLENMYELKDVNDLSEYTLESLNEALTLDVIRDKKVSRERFNEVLDLLRKQKDSFEEDFSKFIKYLEDNKYSLSFIPVTTRALQEDLLYNYFYDERLVRVLDEISDLMLLNSISEDLYSDLSIPVVKGNNVSGNVSFNRVKADLVDVNKSKNMSKYVSKLLNFTTNSLVSADSLLLSYVDNSDELSTLADFLKACYHRDVYDINKYLFEVVSLTSPNSDNYLIRRVYDLATAINHNDIEGDKFSFYFDFDCDRAYRAKFVRLYEEKRFIPKVMEGNTVEEKLAFYENLEFDESNNKNFVPNDLEEVLNNYEDVYKFGQFVDYHNLYKDFINYIFMRDLVYYLSYLDIDLILNMLSLDETISSILLEDDYELPKLDPDVLRDFNLVSLPLLDVLTPGGDDSSSSESNGATTFSSLKSKISLIRKNMNTLNMSYRELPCFANILEKSLGDVLNDSNSFRR